MEFRNIVSLLESLESKLSALESGSAPLSDYPELRASFADVALRLGKCVVRAKEQDPDKRLYGPAQAERVLATHARMPPLEERVAALAGRAAEAAASAQAAGAAAAAAAEAASAALAAQAAQAAQQAELQVAQAAAAAAAAAAAQEASAREAAARLQEEAAARAAVRAVERERAQAALAAQQAAQEAEAQAARDLSLARERLEHQRRVEVVVAAAQGARAGGATSAAAPPAPAPAPGGTVLEAGSAAAFHSLLQAASSSAGGAGVRCCVLLHAAWCPRSKALGPPFLALARRHPGVAFCRVDVDMVPEVAVQAGVGEAPALLAYGPGGSVAARPDSLAELEQLLLLP